MTSTWIHLYLPGDPGYVLSSSFSPKSGKLDSLETPRPKSDDGGKPKVLVLDDEHVIADSVAAILNSSGFEAIARYDGHSALQFIQSECPDILLSDVVMPQLNGIEVAKSVRTHCPGTRIVLISGNANTPNLLQHATAEGAPFELLAKPIHPVHLLRILRG